MTTRLSRPASLGSRASRVASVLLLGGGALVLMADSADCPDGYSAGAFEASFRSTCPPSFGPPEGTLRISLAGGSNPDAQGLQRDLYNAGFKVSGSESQVQHSGGGTCTQPGFVMSAQYKAVGEPLRCQAVYFDRPLQEVKCTATGVRPSALQVGRRDLNDGAVGDADVNADDAAPSDASVGNDSGLVRPPADSGISQTPADFECSITFTRLGS